MIKICPSCNREELMLTDYSFDYQLDGGLLTIHKQCLACGCKLNYEYFRVRPDNLDSVLGEELENHATRF